MPFFSNSKLKLFLGFLCCLLFSFFIVLSIPVYAFRKVVTHIGKVFRSDLGDILSGHSALLVRDNINNASRSNVVAWFTFQGHLTFEEVKQRVLDKWINELDVSNGKLKFDNFQRYPVKWLGFTFWKDASSTFCIDNHVHQYSSKETEVTDGKLSEIVKKLLNEPFHRNESPWEMHVIENYVQPPIDGLCNSSALPHSLLILKWHHCLVDGVGVLDAVSAMLGRYAKTISPTAPPKISIIHQIFNIVTFPIVSLYEMSYFMSHMFRTCPLKCPDGNKEWHQVFAKTGPIPIKHIKDIKSKFSVTYASVVLSAISSAIQKTIVKKSEPRDSSDCSSMLCLNLLPAIGAPRREVLTNHFTGTLFDLPTGPFKDPYERLLAINDILNRSKDSVIPRLVQMFSKIVGAHFYFLCGILRNKMIPIGLSTFATTTDDIDWDGERRWISSGSISGGHDGETGLSISAVSHSQHMGIQICAERAIFTEEEAQLFVDYLVEEIQILLHIPPKATTLQLT